MSARIIIEAHLGFLGIDVLVGSRNHLANPRWWLEIKLRVEVVMMESSNKGDDDLSFCDVRN